MSRLVIRGRKTISGTHRVSGNKNAALPMVAAALLTPEPVTIRNLPAIDDVARMLDVARSFGAQVVRDAAAAYAIDNDIYLLSEQLSSPVPELFVSVSAKDPFVLVSPESGNVRLAPGRGCGYRVRDESGSEDSFSGRIHAVKLDIAPSEKYVCWKASSSTLELTSDSASEGVVVWSSVPAGISGRGRSISFSPNRLSPGTYTVTARLARFPNYKDTCTVHVVKVELVTPSGDPVSAPSDSGDGQNEFTYSSDSPGVLTMNLKARVTPSDAALEIADSCVFRVESIGDSVKAWNAANPSGRAVSSGGSLIATVTYTGLPKRNLNFGKKTASVMFKGIVCDENNYEVFFPRDAANHPGEEASTPNWFYYWGQVSGERNIVYAGSAGWDKQGEIKGMTQWSYDSIPNKTLVYIYDEVVTEGRPYSIGEELSGIDMFMGTIIHEKKHIDQIARADSLLVTHGNDTFRYGWSWNQPLHNHWSAGNDRGWGVAGIDDDGNGLVDDATVRPPFEPGLGDDVSLDHENYVWWPAEWPLPVPNLCSHPIESEAVNATNNAMDEHDNATRDWADPGKQHGTLNDWED